MVMKKCRLKTFIVLLFIMVLQMFLFSHLSMASEVSSSKWDSPWEQKPEVNINILLNEGYKVVSTHWMRVDGGRLIEVIYLSKKHRLFRCSTAALRKSPNEMMHECYLCISPKDLNNVSSSYDDSAISDLKNAYIAAQTNFVDFPNRSINLNLLYEAGFIKSEGVVIQIYDGTQENLSISAYHVDGDKIYFVDATGDIIEEQKN